MSHVHESEKFGTIDLGTIDGVQSALSIMGIDIGEIDGINGPNTRAGVKAFQEQAELAADGVVGPNTREALKNALDQLAAYNE